jgi:hypothetical protein
MAKKKASKKKASKKKITPESLFQDWWEKKASKKVEKIEKDYLKDNPDYDPEDDDMSDSGCVHRMMHEGEAYNMTYDCAEQSFMQGCKKEEHSPDYLYCELDEVISEAYEAGKNCAK